VFSVERAAGESARARDGRPDVERLPVARVGDVVKRVRAALRALGAAVARLDLVIADHEIAPREDERQPDAHQKRTSMPFVPAFALVFFPSTLVRTSVPPRARKMPPATNPIVEIVARESRSSMIPLDCGGHRSWDGHTASSDDFESSAITPKIEPIPM